MVPPNPLDLDAGELRFLHKLVLERHEKAKANIERVQRKYGSEAKIDAFEDSTRFTANLMTKIERALEGGSR
jgi:hypothetical protein